MIATEEKIRAWDFQAPGLIAFGAGKAAEIGALVKSRIVGKVVLVTAPVLLRKGVAEPVLRSRAERACPARFLPRPSVGPPAWMRTRP